MLYVLYDILREWLFDRGLVWPLAVLDQLEVRALGALGVAFAAVVLCGRRVIRWLVSMKVGDSGITDAEALRAVAAGKSNIPTMGGVLIVSAILIATLLLADVRQFYVQLGVVVLVWLAALGGMDDFLKLTAARRGAGSRQGLYAWEKLVFQLGVGVLVGYFAYRHGATEGARDLQHVLNVPFQKTYENKGGVIAEGLVYLSLPVFVLIMTLMVAGLSNAVNITDGMDGLASGTMVAAALGLLILAFVAGDLRWAQELLVPHVPGAGELGVVLAAIVGACLGFLWWNCAPAQVFMGDTGSLSLGGILGYIAVVTRQEFVVLVMCGVFLLEIASVVMQVGWFKYTRIRTGTGRRIFRVAPFHHHLHMGGWQESQVVSRLWIVAVLCVVIGLVLVKLR
ncbi:MAG: phospho-N-acetylmuramoyl-pentapeptide-transferase [Phycisphaerales bacterium]|nr:MAG: phospho-N-acetylmuramoyl-pentapeptide-transferase [Phycisphaerales bacterium]